MSQVGYMDQSMIIRLFHKSLIFRNTVFSTKMLSNKGYSSAIVLLYNGMCEIHCFLQPVL